MNFRCIAAAALLVAGCAGAPRAGYIGHFAAATGDVIEIQRDGAITWTPTNTGRPVFLGILSLDRRDPTAAGMIAPSASRYLGTQLHFSPDRQTLTIAWPDWAPREATRTPLEFHRRPVP